MLQIYIKIITIAYSYTSTLITSYAKLNPCILDEAIFRNYLLDRDLRSYDTMRLRFLF